MSHETFTVAGCMVCVTGHDARAVAAKVRNALASDSPKEPSPSTACIGCANTDSWGLPSQPFCPTCVSGSLWVPLNAALGSGLKGVPK